MDDISGLSVEELSDKVEEIRSEIARLRLCVPQTEEISKTIIALIEKRHSTYTAYLSKKDELEQNKELPKMNLTSDQDMFIDQYHVITSVEEPLILKAMQDLDIKDSAGTATEKDKQRFSYLVLKLREKINNDSVELYTKDAMSEAKLKQAKIDIAATQDQINTLLQEHPHLTGFKKPARPAKRKLEEVSPPNLEDPNKFAVLETDHMDHLEAVIENKEKVPPLIISNPSLWAEIKHLLAANHITDYSCTSKQDRLVYIMSDINIYYKTKKLFHEKNYPFHWYSNNSEKKLKVVIKNIPADMQVEDIKDALLEKGYPVHNVYQLRKTVERRKVPLPIFFVELQYGGTSDDIYNLTDLLHLKIRIEPYRKRKSPTQCHRCQRYGHTKNNCNNPPRCVKCAGDHITSECPSKFTEKPKCALCGEDHVASFSGCSKVPKPKNQININSDSATPTENTPDPNPEPRADAIINSATNSNNLLQDHMNETNQSSSVPENDNCFKTLFIEFMSWFKSFNIAELFKRIKSIFGQLKQAKNTLEKIEILINGLDSVMEILI